MGGGALLDEQWVSDLLAAVVAQLPEPTVDLTAVDLTDATDGCSSAAVVAVRLAGAAGLAGYGVIMSFWRLSTPTWHVDERVYAVAGRAYWQGDYRPNPQHPPLGKELIGAAQAAFGPTLAAARLPAAAAALAGGLVLWLWLSRAAAPAAGPLAAVLWWSMPSALAFPEALPAGLRPETSLPTRYALLDPLAGVLALGALAVGWWWVRSGRWSAAAGSGVLLGLAVATKLPVGMVGAVAVAAGSAAALRRPGTRPRRVLRAGAQAATWSLAAVAAFVAAYAPMGLPGAVASWTAGWRSQRAHGQAGHLVVVAGRPDLHPPWWTLGWWQYASWGTAAAAVAALAVGLGLALQPSLAGYLTAAWLLPLVLLVPLAHLALPHYPVIWRGPLLASIAVGAAAAARRLRRRIGWWLALAVVLGALTPTVLLAARTTAATLTLRPTGYAALPALVPPGDVWLVGYPDVARPYLAGHRVMSPPRRPEATARPAAVVLDAMITVRTGDRRPADWAREHDYRVVRSYTLEIWIPSDG
jgi:hypothetical protein